MKAGSTLWLNINVTYDCNANCDFCYLKGLSLPNSTMSKEIIDALCKRCEEHVEKVGLSDRYGFSLLGGEPFIHKEAVDYLVKGLKVKFPAKSRYIFTNGILLDEEFVSYCKENKLAVILSANNSDTDFLREKMKILSGHPSLLSITLDEFNLDRLQILVDVAHELNFNIRMYHDHNGPFREGYLKKYDEVVCNVISYIANKKYIFNPYFFFEKTVPWRTVEYFSYSCGQDHFSIDPNGDVKTCPGWGEVIDNICNNGFNFVDCSKKHVFRYTYDKISECMNCEYRRICGGGCPLTKMKLFGNTNKPSPLCDTFKKVFPYIIEIANQWKNKGKNLRW